MMTSLWQIIEGRSGMIRYFLDILRKLLENIVGAIGGPSLSRGSSDGRGRSRSRDLKDEGSYRKKRRSPSSRAYHAEKRARSRSSYRKISRDVEDAVRIVRREDREDFWKFVTSKNSLIMNRPGVLRDIIELYYFLSDNKSGIRGLYKTQIPHRFSSKLIGSHQGERLLVEWHKWTQEIKKGNYGWSELYDYFGIRSAPMYFPMWAI